MIAAVDHRAVLASVDVPVLGPDAAGIPNPLLNRRLSFLEQLETYRRYNMRYQ